ncbi:hypothetical protein EAI28_22920 [Faecalicatena contorta]|uniref:hypothetical protein n=1 Tax=Faecalicatena contorta TaxID=39482 RepID=UPI00129E7286|nr:hypothetical protein [Faecalicatena contorta]MRM91181.1 hypothetical protein [Faecalicatena contorta]
MKTYADYQFYVENYHGQMDETDFQRHALSAAQYIRYLTIGKSDEYEGEELKYAVCEAADVLYTANQRNSLKGEKKSENTDGYSVSYVVEGKDGETSEELSNRKMAGVVKKWLLPTGLLYTGARCGHAYKH